MPQAIERTAAKKVPEEIVTQDVSVFGRMQLRRLSLMYHELWMVSEVAAKLNMWCWTSAESWQRRGFQVRKAGFADKVSTSEVVTSLLRSLTAAA